MWSISRVNNFLPPSKAAHGLMGVADGDVAAVESAVTTMTNSSSSTVTHCRLRGSSQTGLPVPVAAASTSPSATASFFVR
ncbi:hypothetical protein OJAV_G00213870 [Oryzias javanicus]|uniref:Uncharacterized protein n=1 Tax=Oryzias javanicus TaxID=123683 RepID=A0A437C3D1_ORYJA|nr:hypothetical protein OJAV_G00213870 [Oryzias javanicus]